MCLGFVVASIFPLSPQQVGIILGVPPLLSSLEPYPGCTTWNSVIVKQGDHLPQSSPPLGRPESEMLGESGVPASTFLGGTWLPLSGS